MCVCVCVCVGQKETEVSHSSRCLHTDSNIFRFYADDFMALEGEEVIIISIIIIENTVLCVY